jgi:hypothetical protein
MPHQLAIVFQWDQERVRRTAFDWKNNVLCYISVIGYKTVYTIATFVP